ncbi:hypothetical protein Prum_024260 [Phytohabitans rumicis]|uniref:Uncharacterized protein n=1 Tax=Phytohabitans rumicis TaxID=1076125 RepID=A0A6V8KY83_9ACTN|nr:hypothetical protein Prum_024260 [Phytohabitans rumicis]
MGLLGELPRQPQRQRLTHRLRLVSPVDDEAVQARDQRAGVHRIGRRGTLVHAAHHPARPVDADEAQVGQALGGTDAGAQLDAVLAVDLLGRDTVVEERLADLRTDLFPDALGTRSREHAELEGVVAVHQHHLLDRAIGVRLHPDLYALDRRDLQAAQVEPLHPARRLGHVVRPYGRDRLRLRGLHEVTGARPAVVVAARVPSGALSTPREHH